MPCGAILLILEMNSPLTALMQISSAPMRQEFPTPRVRSDVTVWRNVPL
jgi:hypothetical protein